MIRHRGILGFIGCIFFQSCSYAPITEMLQNVSAVIAIICGILSICKSIKDLFK